MRNLSREILIAALIYVLPYQILTFTEVEEDEEEEYVKIYGNDVNTSGIWEPVRSYASNTEKLQNISLQVHKKEPKLYQPEDEIDTAIFDTRTLLHTKDGLKDIQLDLIRYAVVRAPKQYIYIGKGMKPDCVHLLLRVDDDALYFFLGRHICNITL